MVKLSTPGQCSAFVSKKRKMAKTQREAKLKNNSEEVRKDEKFSKSRSRSKQTSANHNYERPRYIENLRILYEGPVLDKWQKRGRMWDKCSELEKKLFGKETWEEKEKRHDKEKDVHGEETLEQRIKRYEDDIQDKKWKSQQLKEKAFLDRNKHACKLLSNRNPNF